MHENLLFEKLRAGEVALGLCNMYPASGIIEGMCTGWDFVWIDGQHGEMSYQPILHATQAAMAVGVESLIRVPGHEHSILGVYADLAPSAIMVPMVDTPEQARHIAAGLRFPPLGVRSFGGRRVIDLYGREYFTERELLVVAQTETLAAVENAPAVIGTEGIDCLFFGPDDMKVRMGVPINTAITDSPEIREAMQRTADAARDAGKFSACVATSASGIEMAVSMGYQLIVGGGDIACLRVIAAQRLAELREAVSGATQEVEAGGRGGVY